MNDETFEGNLSAEESLSLVQELDKGVNERIALPAIFRALADDISDRRLQAVALKLTERLERGDDLPAALAAVQPTIPVHLREALAVGVESGNLSAMLRGLAEGELARRDMRRSLWSVFAYPLLVLILLTLLLFYVFLVLCPMFESLFQDFDLDLPAISVLLLALSHAMPWIIGGMIVVGLITILLASVQNRLLHWLRTALPFLGRAFVWSGQHEFASMMATLTNERIPVVNALDCTIRSLRDRNIARAARKVQQECLAGKELGIAMADSIHFDRTLTSLVTWGEKNNSLPLALREATATYLEQMALYSDFLQRIVPPLLLVVVAVVLLFSAGALVIPLLELINGLTG